MCVRKGAVRTRFTRDISSVIHFTVLKSTLSVCDNFSVSRLVKSIFLANGSMVTIVRCEFPLILRSTTRIGFFLALSALAQLFLIQAPKILLPSGNLYSILYN